MQPEAPNILISGGGTGGHLFPAIAIADAIGERLPAARILFIGAQGRIEMREVPAAGYEVVGLPISGLPRSLSMKALAFPLSLGKSLWRARRIVRRFRPDVAIGTGGYASGPALCAASSCGVPILIQEQNAQPGLTNRLLSRRARHICVAYPAMQRYFSPEKLRLTGNPLRAELLATPPERAAAKRALGFRPDQQLILSLGGSQGSRTLNRAWERVADTLDVQLLWHTGVEQYPRLKSLQRPGIRVVDFISHMSTAYAAADLVVSRAGALAIAELSVLGKASILVPFPAAAGDHQTQNARALEVLGAAQLLSDAAALEQLWPRASALLGAPSALRDLERKIGTLAKPKATETIVDLILKTIR